MTDIIKLKQWFMDFSVDDAKKQHLQQFLNTPSNRRLINLLRVRYWYEGVKQRTGLATAYQLERHFEPLTKTEIDKRTPFRNKWSGYQAGKHKPGAALTNLVDAEILGSARELNHPLWEVLRLGERVLPKIDDWMEKLEPRIQAVVYYQPEGMTALKLRQPYSSALSNRLVKLGNLDALTALMLYWLESKQTEQAANMRYQARGIYQLLLMMGIDFCDRNIAEELFVVFLARVFYQTDWDDRLFAINPVHYVRGVERLYCLLFEVSDSRPFSSWTARCRTMYQLLDGKYVLYIKIGLGIVLMPNWQYGPPTEMQWKAWHSDFIGWQWGWIHLNQGTIGTYGSDSLWKALAKQHEIC